MVRRLLERTAVGNILRHFYPSGAEDRRRKVENLARMAQTYLEQTDHDHQFRDPVFQGSEPAGTVLSQDYRDRYPVRKDFPDGSLFMEFHQRKSVSSDRSCIVLRSVKGADHREFYQEQKRDHRFQSQDHTDDPLPDPSGGLFVPDR